ncbi:hypothetical protein CCE29_08180 [Lacticaseibacillus rhamnosus]|uniref:Uncharacterized protein n=2 Tax=Lacticaseibacillus rhamnosus TaxID=47715 RepID=A0A5P5ZEU8_LACRH|nr:DUF3923 family protein [Lacticaseibacillus rhamnosus]OFJ91229.1 hypothetical protein HMPREF2838_10780 [Lactobacillus sp. HMSC066G01]OFP98849.1 hypothetical protein HMPREF2965_03115 [Lactobacillus sp. HMSC075D02]OFQ45750.1 hypothetical protein HMPREF2934_11115 [Lactobacillus sp. HMSC073B09]AON64208.1 hypothetical protein BFC96_11510 [Lacticaseibacillus rhamnosus]AQG73192.1 hypothetical protein AWJ15_09515 [Lacticaseibacillus rhamnosus]
MKHKGLWITNIVLAIAISGIGIRILMRRVDGAGHVETAASRLAALAVLVVFILIIAIVEGIYLLISRRHG